MKEILRNAEDKLNKKGYCVANMLAPYNDSYEVYNGDMQVVIAVSYTQLTLPTKA